MFFRRRCRCSLLHVILLLLGAKAVRSRCNAASPEQKDAFRAKSRLFRSRLMDAFAVWTEQEKKEAAEAPAEQQG